MVALSQTELNEITPLKQKMLEMFKWVQMMFHSTFDGLMEHDIGVLNQVLKEEEKITMIYNDLTTLAVEISKKDLSGKAKRIILDWVDIICTIERIGDCCVGLVERIEYKIRENLLFSEEAVAEYKDLHNKVEQTLLNTIKLAETEDSKLRENILNDKAVIDVLVEKSRANHIDRSARGICDEWAKVRYLDMLDFVKEITHFCMDIAGKLIRE